MEPITFAALISLSALGGPPAVQTPPAAVQDTPARARARTATQSLNQAPAESTLGQTPASPPLATTARPRATAPATSPSAVTQAAPRASAPRVAPTRPVPQTAPARTETPAPAAAAELDIAALAGPPSALPPLQLGYYVRGDLNCDQVWPGEGDLAWLSATAFVLDFGGCEPGAIQQVSDTVWREDQQCLTELGGDGGAFSVGYDIRSTTVLARTTRLALDGAEQQDIWTHCDADQVPAEARFQS